MEPPEQSVSLDDPSSPRSSISSTQREIWPGPSATANLGQGHQRCPSGPSLHSQQQEPQHQHQERRPTASPSPSPSPAGAHSRKISASSIAASNASRKSRYVDSVPSETNAEPFSFPIASQPTPIPVKGAHSPSWHSRPQSGISDAGNDALVFGEPHPSPTHSDILRIRAELNAENAAHVWLPEPSLTARSSLSDLQSRRLSSTSIYSLASARGIINYSSSAHGSDSGALSRSVSGLMSSSKGASAGTPPEPGLPTAAAATSSPNGSNPNGQHNLATRDATSQPLDLMRRNQRTDSNMRAQPDRSRSRAKRRFSGSTATSTHSQGSDRGAHREKEEGNAKPK